MLNPHTPPSAIEYLIEDLDMVLLMSVNPGFGGQQFIPNTLRKVQKLRNLIDTAQSKALIEVDGGVNGVTAAQLVNAGADILVAGNYIFKSSNPKETIRELAALTRQ